MIISFTFFLIDSPTLSRFIVLLIQSLFFVLLFSLNDSRLFAPRSTNISPLSQPRLYTQPTRTQPLLLRMLSNQLPPTSLPFNRRFYAYFITRCCFSTLPFFNKQSIFRQHYYYSTNFLSINPQRFSLRHVFTFSSQSCQIISNGIPHLTYS